MFDQLRQQSMGGKQDDDDEAPAPVSEDNPTLSDAPSVEAPARPRRSFNPGGLAGRRLPLISSLNPMQRFVLALMLFLNVSVLGCFALLAFGKIGF